MYKNVQLLFEDLAAENLPDFLLAAYKNLGQQYPKFCKMDNLSKLGWLATEILLKESKIKERYSPEEIGIVLSNNNASLDTDQKYFETAKDIASPALFVYTLPNIVIGEISIRHGFKGENGFFVTEKFDAEFIQQYVTGLLNNDNLQACICGWTECLGNQYKAALFLVEKNETTITFSTENINNIYQK